MCSIRCTLKFFGKCGHASYLKLTQPIFSSDKPLYIILVYLRTCRTCRTWNIWNQEGLSRPDREWAPTGAPRRLRAKIAPAQVVRGNHQYQVTPQLTTTQNTSKINPALNLLRRFHPGMDQTRSLTLFWTRATFCSPFFGGIFGKKIHKWINLRYHPLFRYIYGVVGNS